MPGRNYQRVLVPIARGLSQDTDPRMRQPDRLEAAENVTCTASMRLEKRHALTEITRNVLGTADTVITNGPVRGLAGCGDELLLLGHRQLFAYSSTVNEWIDRGHIAPCGVSFRGSFRARGNYQMGDIGRSNSYLVRAAHRDKNNVTSIASTPDLTIDYEICDLNDVVVKPRTVFASGVLNPRCPRLVGLSDRVAMFYEQTGEVFRTHTLDSAPDAGFVAATSLTANFYADPYSNARTFDACAVRTGTDYTHLFAWIRASDSDIELRGLVNAGTSAQNVTIGGTFIRVAVADSPTLDRVYVAGLRDVGAGLYTLTLYSLQRSSLSSGPVWSKDIVTTATPSVNLDNIGIVEGAIDGGTVKVYVSFLNNTGMDSDGSTTRCLLTCYSVTTDGATAAPVSQAYNMVASARPFFYRGRLYQEAAVWLRALGFCARYLVDLGPYAGTTMALAGIYHVGQANMANDYARIGNCNSVVVMPDGTTHRHMATVVVEADSFSDATPQLGVDEVEYRFDEAPTVAQLPGPCAAVGGAYVAYYDGAQTCELGFGAPPVLDSTLTVDTPATGVIADGTYQLTTIFEQVDNRGILHRSLPAPPFEIEVAGGGGLSSIDYSWRTLPASRRPASAVTAQFYRSGSENVSFRRNSAYLVVPNDNANWLGATYRDTGQFQGPALYTTGGVLENVSPNGSRVVFSNDERLWVGGDSRLQFSKRFTPGTIDSQAIAPEMMEALTRIIPVGDTITGMSKLDGTTVVLTESNVYIIGGEGPDPRGAGDDYSRLLPRQVDWGCTEPRSVASYPDGIIYLSKRGFYKIDPKFNVTPIGEAVRETIAGHTCTSAVVVPDANHIRFTFTNGSTTGFILIYDYRIGEWFTWLLRRPNDAGSSINVALLGGAYVGGTYYVLDYQGRVHQESTSAYKDVAGATYVTQRVKTGWVQPNGPETHYRLRRFTLLANKVGDHGLTVRLYANYDSATPTVSWVLTQAQVDALSNPTKREGFMFRVPSAYAKGTAFMVEVLDTSVVGGTGAGFQISAIAFDMAWSGPPARGQSQAQV